MVKEKITDVDFSSSFKSNFYDYGMDTIEDRALPDVRDGLKPVHRAIMTEMLTSHITSKNKPVKVAKITGAVIGRWHPHGDSSVEDALAGMAAPWKNSMPAINIKGNGGSVYGDGHAAGRYIEARLSPTGDAYGKNLKKGIVPYVPNFDETAYMPSILPAQLPYLIINGGEGIAVGVASSIPPHNPIEVINAFISYAKNPKQTVAELMEIMKGPDFPTSGEIINKSELSDIYETGLGKIRVRGRMRYDKKTNTIHIYEIPYPSSGSMDKLVDEITLASMETVSKDNKKTPPKLPGITEVKEHSGKDGIDIFIELKRGVNPEEMMKMLYAKTRLETTQKFNFSALNNRRLRRYGLKSYFKEYLTFQHNIIINEFTINKQELENRMEIILGLLILQTMIDEVVSSAKNASGKAEVLEVLTTGKIVDGVPAKYHKKISTFRFSEVQAEHISTLPIYKINKLDYSALIDEGKQIKKDIAYADTIINDTTKRKRLIIKRHEAELKKLDEKEFSRKTSIIDAAVSTVSKLEVPESPLFMGYDKYQYLRIEEKEFEKSVETTNKSRIGFFDETGICWNIHLENQQPTKANGVLINQLIDAQSSIIGYSNAIDSNDEVFGLFIYTDGNIRITDMRKYMTKTKSKRVTSGKSDFKLLKMMDIPKGTNTIIINDLPFSIDDFSVNGVSGHGKHMIGEFDQSEDVTVAFSTDIISRNSTESKKSQRVDANKATAHFMSNGILNFDWTGSDTPENPMFSIAYDELMNTDLLFVHTDGTAKIVNGSQFKVATKRKEIVCDKKDMLSMYIGRVPETMVANYSDGTSKRVKTELISTQGKTGGGVRAFYTTRHELESVMDGANSVLDCVSLATQPK